MPGNGQRKKQYKDPIKIRERMMKSDKYNLEMTEKDLSGKAVPRSFKNAMRLTKMTEQRNSTQQLNLLPVAPGQFNSHAQH